MKVILVNGKLPECGCKVADKGTGHIRVYLCPEHEDGEGFSLEITEEGERSKYERGKH